MTTIPDHYAALGIDPTADPEVITAAYRALAKKFHPDTGAAAGTASAERFDEIQKAYEVLRSPEGRHAYDLELLAATEAELEQHLASKRRVALREREREREAEHAAAAAPPDLGDIRPEPATPPRARPAGAKPRRSVLPFVIPLVLMMVLGGGAAWLFLPAGPAAPPLPQATSGSASVEPAAPAPSTAAPAANATAASATPPAPAPAKPAGEPPQQATAEDGPPVFGSSVTDSEPPSLDLAAATPEPVPAPDAPVPAAAKSDKPSFGSSLEGDDAVVAPAEPTAVTTPSAAPQPPPVPKPRPAQPTRQAVQQKPVQKSQQQAQAQPRAKLTYQNPPQYSPQPDGYPPPGYPAPGYEPPDYVPPGYDPRAQYDPPPGYDGDIPPPGYVPGAMAGEGPYRLVIFERQPGRQATAWSAGVVFNSIGKCTRQGVKAVLRRTADMDPYSDGTKVWYECQQFSQR